MKQNKLLIIIFILPTLVMGQKKTNAHEQLEAEVMAYKRLFNYADSLHIRGKVGQVSSAVMATAKALDKSRPVAYFEKAAELVGKGDYNGASFYIIWGTFDSGIIIPQIHSMNQVETGHC